MAYSIANNHLLRKNFAKIKNIIEIPNLIDIQKDSYRRFLQQEASAESRINTGLEAVFRSVFPIKDFSESASLAFACGRGVHTCMPTEKFLFAACKLVLLGDDVPDRLFPSCRDVSKPPA